MSFSSYFISSFLIGKILWGYFQDSNPYIIVVGIIEVNGPTVINCFHETFLSGEPEIERFFFRGILETAGWNFFLKDSQHTLYAGSWKLNITGINPFTLNEKVTFQLTVYNIIPIDFMRNACQLLVCQFII